LALQFASPALRSDPTVVEAAVKSHPGAREYALGAALAVAPRAVSFDAAESGYHQIHLVDF
jgi:hypothetical protein